MRATLLALLLFLANDAAACVCAWDPPKGTFEEQIAAKYAAHDLVMVMNVAGFETRRLTVGGASERRRWVVFEPVRVFKGTVGPDQRFYAELGGHGDCKVHAHVGESWLIYAERDAPVRLYYCSSESGLLAGMLDEVGELLKIYRGNPG